MQANCSSEIYQEINIIMITKQAVFRRWDQS